FPLRILAAGAVIPRTAPAHRIVPVAAFCMVIRPSHPCCRIASTVVLRVGAAHRPAAFTQRWRSLRSVRAPLRRPAPAGRDGAWSRPRLFAGVAEVLVVVAGWTGGDLVKPPITVAL